MNDPIQYNFKKKICFLEMSPAGPNQNHKNLFTKNPKCDFYYVTFKKKINKNNKLCLGYFPNTVWCETRNALAKLVPKRYEYYCFMDDDIKFVSQTELGVVDQIIKDLCTYNPAVMSLYYKNDDRELKNLCKGVCKTKLFTNNCVKIIHHSLLDWFFPLPKIWTGTYECAHLFNFLEIPFAEHIIESHNVIMINDVHNFNYTQNAKVAMESMWRYMKEGFKKIHAGKDTMDIKKYYIQPAFSHAREPHDPVRDYHELVRVMDYFLSSHGFFKKYRREAFKRIIDGKFNYIHIPKSGGETIERLLRFGKDHRRAKDKGTDGAFTFAFIRNPWDRLVSWYFHCRKPLYMDQIKRSITNELEKECACYRALEIVGDITLTKYTKLAREVDFKEWVNIMMTDSTYDDSSFRYFNDQTEWILDENDNLIVDYLADFYRYDQELAFILKLLGRDELVKYIFKGNRSLHKPYKEYYDEETKRFVADRYKKEIEYFKFKF